MPTALLPSGKTAYVDQPLDLSVSFPDRALTANVEQTLRKGLAADPRQLFVRVQGGGGYGPWCFWIQWGTGPKSVLTRPTCLSEEEHTPEAILNRVRTELAALDGSSAKQSQ